MMFLLPKAGSLAFEVVKFLYDNGSTTADAMEEEIEGSEVALHKLIGNGMVMMKGSKFQLTPQARRVFQEEKPDSTSIATVREVNMLNRPEWKGHPPQVVREGSLTFLNWPSKGGD